jgi:hypothetical protein
MVHAIDPKTCHSTLYYVTFRAHHVGRGRRGRVDGVADGDVVDPVGRGGDELRKEHGGAVDELGELVHLGSAAAGERPEHEADTE